MKSTINGGTGTLPGSVPTEEDRKLAIDIVRSVSQVDAVIDDMDV